MELIVVMILVALMATMVTPMFRQSIVSIKASEAVNEILAAMQFARERAILDSIEYRVYFDEVKQEYWVSQFVSRNQRDEKVFEPVAEYEHRTSLPETVVLRQIDAIEDRDDGTKYIPFYPNGACAEAKLRLEKPGGETVIIDTEGVSGVFNVEERGS